MKILLAENFPLGLVSKLREEGQEVEHIILLGLRGMADTGIIERLNTEDILFLTNDQEFLTLRLARSAAIVSRVTQCLPLATRIDLWRTAVRQYFSGEWNGRVFEVFDDGRLRPWSFTAP